MNLTIDLLVDDKRGRRPATQLGIPIIGTLGILERAAGKDLIRLDDAIRR